MIIQLYDIRYTAYINSICTNILILYRRVEAVYITANISKKVFKFGYYTEAYRHVVFDSYLLELLETVLSGMNWSIRHDCYLLLLL